MSDNMYEEKCTPPRYLLIQPKEVGTHTTKYSFNRPQDDMTSFDDLGDAIKEVKMHIEEGDSDPVFIYELVQLSIEKKVTVAVQAKRGE